MRIPTAAFGFIVLSLIIALSTPPPAHADDTSFTRTAKSMGFVQSSPNLVSTAKSACYFLWLNRHPAQVEQRILRYTRVQPEQAHNFFVLAVNEYCPQYKGLVGP